MPGFLALDLPCGGFCLVFPPVPMNCRKGESWRLLLLVPSFWTQSEWWSPEKLKENFDVAVFCCLVVCLWLEKINEGKADLNCVQHCLGCAWKQNTQLGMAAHSLPSDGTDSGIWGRWRSVPRRPQEAVSASWHGSGTAGPGLVPAWMVWVA